MKSILVVDDSVDLLEAFNFIFDKYNFKCYATTAPAQVFEYLNTFSPELILLDVVINGEDCRHICKQIKSDVKNKSTPVILMSGSPEKLKDYKSYYADDILQKPFSMECLTELVNKHS